MTNFEQWNGFKGSKWRDDIDTRDFIIENYTPYDGDESFLEGPTEATDKLWGKLQELRRKNVPKAAFLIWTHISLPTTAHKRAILMKV